MSEEKGAKHWDFGTDLCIGAVVDACLCFAPLTALSSPTLQLVTVLFCGNESHSQALCCCEHLRFLSPTRSLPSHAHTRTRCDTEPTCAFVSLLLLLLLSLWCAQPSLQQHWCRRSSGDCRGAEEQQHAAEAGVSAVCVDLGWWMRLCLW